MRTLSTEEKSFITELVRISNVSKNVFLANVVDKELNNTDVYLDFTNYQVEYRFDQNLYSQDPIQFTDFARNFSWKMMRYINLLRDLEKEGMLFLYQESQSVNNSRFGRLIKGREFIPSSINDKQAKDLLLEYTKKTILINQSLIDFEGNNFKTEEDLKHIESVEYSKKNLYLADESLKSSLKSLDIASKSLKSGNKSLTYSRYTLIATILVFVIGTIINIVVSNKDQESIVLDEKQFNLIYSSLKQAHQELNSKIIRIQYSYSQIDSVIHLTQDEIRKMKKHSGNSFIQTNRQLESIRREMSQFQIALNKLNEEIE